MVVRIYPTTNKVLVRIHTSTLKVVVKIYSTTLNVAFRIHTSTLKVAFRIHTSTLKVAFRTHTSILKMVIRIFTFTLKVVVKIYIFIQRIQNEFVVMAFAAKGKYIALINIRMCSSIVFDSSTCWCIQTEARGRVCKTRKLVHYNIPFFTSTNHEQPLHRLIQDSVM